MLAILRQLGVDTYLLSSTLYTYSPWNNESIETLECDFVSKVFVHNAGRANELTVKAIRKCYDASHKPVPVTSWVYHLTGLREWYKQKIQDLNPDILWMNYAMWDGIVDRRLFNDRYTVMDMIDLVSINQQMSLSIYNDLKKYARRQETGASSIFNENYYQNLNARIDPRELEVYDRYDLTLAINPNEAQMLRQVLQKTKILYAPMSCDVHSLDNRYDGPSVFLMGPNSYNVHGFYYFTRKVLPIIHKSCPDFLLEVTGLGSSELPVTHGVQQAGFIEDLSEVYQKARFAICPVYGGTGQKVKIVEALAYGVPVVAMKAATEGSPLVHGENGYIVEDAESFAESVARLWMNPDLCRKMGERARDIVSATSSRDSLRQSLSQLLPRS
jgi:glycosyltransferase involved in cell wall biosynthesis